MSTIFDIRNLRLSKVPRRAILIGALVVVLGLVLVAVGVFAGKRALPETDHHFGGRLLL